VTVSTKLARAGAYIELAHDTLVPRSAWRAATFLTFTLSFTWRRATISFVKVWATWLVTFASVLVVITDSFARLALGNTPWRGSALALPFAFTFGSRGCWQYLLHR
jgi:hypothetical protein